MKVSTRPLRIGEGISFKEAEHLYGYYKRYVEKKRYLYTPIKPLFIHVGEKVFVLYQSVSQVNLVIPNSRMTSKQGWCEKVTLKGMA